VLRMVGLPSGRPMSKEAREHRPHSALLTFSLAMMVSAAVLTAALSEPARPLLVQIMPRAPASTGTNFDYLVIILMENHNLCAILTSCGGSATYMSNLADAWGLARDDHYCNVNPSLPTYLCLTGGSDFGCSGYDGAPISHLRRRPRTASGGPRTNAMTSTAARSRRATPTWPTSSSGS